MFDRFIVIVMDSVGIGEMPDAEKFGDKGADTLGHIDSLRGLNVPNMEKLGLGLLRDFKTIKKNQIKGAYSTTMFECSKGKDTTTGHWEMMGVILEKSFPTYPDGFPKEVMDKFTQETGYGYLGNKPASGTVIINELGDEHVKTGKPIVYTSADSVFQIAAHEDVIPVDELYRICEITRNRVCVGEHAVARVIARPFIKEGDKYVRTERRKDFSLEPPYPTAMDLLKENGYQVGGIGKIEDIFVYRGLTASIHSHNNYESYRDLKKMMNDLKGEKGLVFANFIDFDMLYGHRRNVEGYGKALEEFDNYLEDIMDNLGEKDLLMVTADHGNDPSFKGSDHTRERVPLLMFSKLLKENGRIEDLHCFSSIAKTVCENFSIENKFKGENILEYLK
ncbi:phosphopentomutase [Thermotomaculum hydrothermale]|uniref:Phosphopentomutase n=1 Tax=Thermotomaculum hydrothermale TaxID=981385 RepID=A0A7R6SXG2_9BACT|nr:phosphopentomutase [Thermotomaculum hydrothermale]BBB31754.1 phosphopentomutase [Thermotomaculum hydrothermale]